MPSMRSEIIHPRIGFGLNDTPDYPPDAEFVAHQFCAQQVAGNNQRLAFIECARQRSHQRYGVDVNVGVCVEVAGAGVSLAGIGVFVAGTGVSVGIGVSVGGTGVCVGGTGVCVGGTGVRVAGAGVDVLTIMGVHVGCGVWVGGIGVGVGGMGVKVNVKENLNCVGVGSRGGNVEKLAGMSVMVGGGNVSEGTAPAPVAVTAPCNVGVPGVWRFGAMPRSTKPTQ